VSSGEHHVSRDMLILTKDMIGKVMPCRLTAQRKSDGGTIDL
jgi:hypothetical protein